VHGGPQDRHLGTLETRQSESQDLRGFFRGAAGSEDARLRQSSLRLNCGEPGDVAEVTCPGGSALGRDQVPTREFGIDKQSQQRYPSGPIGRNLIQGQFDYGRREIELSARVMQAGSSWHRFPPVAALSQEAACLILAPLAQPQLRQSDGGPHPNVAESAPRG
jgi:hypothetical protein